MPRAQTDRPRTSRLHITQADYDALVAAYRVAPGNHGDAARRTSFSYNTCLKYWEFGSKKRGRVLMEPIKSVLEAEIAESRARVATDLANRTAADLERAAKARAQAIEAQGEELRGTQALRRNALVLLGVGQRATVIAHRTLELLGEQVGVVFGADGKPAYVKPNMVHTPTTLARVTDLCAKVARVSANTFNLALEAERVASGQPIAKIEITGLERMDTKTLAAELGRFRSMVERAERRHGRDLPEPLPPDEIEVESEPPDEHEVDE